MEKLCKIGADSEVGYYLLSRRQNTNITNANTGLVLTGSPPRGHEAKCG